jgi:hypothetical protein
MVLAVCLLCAACFDPRYDAVLCSERGQCPDGLACVADRCVAPGTDAPVPDAVPPICTPGCEGDVLVSCPGGVATREECALGCLADAPMRCAAMVPSNGASADDLTLVPQDRPFVIPAGAFYVVDTDTGRIVDGDGLEVRPATTGGALHEGTGTFFARRSERIAVFILDSLTIETDAILQGDGERGLVILARGDVVVRGAIDVSAGCRDVGGTTCGGPGGGAGASNVGAAGGCARGGNGAGAAGGGEVGAESGGGGGGLGSSGGAGGRAGSDALPRPGGVAGQPSATCPPPSLDPLIGGSGGGAGGVGDVNGGTGGGGGGALQISSFTSIRLESKTAGNPPSIRASGGGGSAPITAAQGGGGGGSGGAILLESPTIALGEGAYLVANGGGGGSGTMASSTGRASGVNGLLSAAQAPGGAGDDDNQGSGGMGAALAGPAGSGGPVLDGGGGGGGGGGIIRLNRRTRTVGRNAIISPAHTEGALTLQ